MFCRTQAFLPADATKPYRTYVDAVLAIIERRLSATYGYSAVDETFEGPYADLSAAVAPADPSAFRAAVDPLLSAYAAGVDDEAEPAPFNQQIDQLICEAAGIGR